MAKPKARKVTKTKPKKIYKVKIQDLLELAKPELTNLEYNIFSFFVENFYSKRNFELEKDVNNYSTYGKLFKSKLYNLAPIISSVNRYKKYKYIQVDLNYFNTIDGFDDPSDKNYTFVIRFNHKSDKDCENKYFKKLRIFETSSGNEVTFHATVSVKQVKKQQKRYQKK
jgi:hypothetical protein